MAGRLSDARSTLEELLKQLADKQETLRYFYIKAIFHHFGLPPNMISLNSTILFYFSPPLNEDVKEPDRCDMLYILIFSR
jgi:NDP-sugar pyrophosphorylase family protein